MASGAHLALVRIAREMWDRGLVAGSSGNLSARLDDGSVLITPTRASFARIQVDDLVHLNRDGNPVHDGQRPSVERPLHVAAYRARPEIRYVVHTHPTYCVVWANRGELYPRTTVAAMESLAEMVWVRYEPSGSQALADACERGLATGAPLALLERHGLIAVSHDIDEAFIQTDLAEGCAKVAYLDALWSRPSHP
ncbi:MAG: class II aldolase/adducin family protein [Candidatus Velthaea sp.]